MLGLSDVFEVGGNYYFFVDGSYVRLQRNNGDPLPLQGGWKPESVLVGLPNVSILFLRHVNGDRSIWFHDKNYYFHTILLDSLPAQARSEILSAFPEFPKIAYNSLPRIATASPDFERDTALFPNAYLAGMKIFNDVTIGEMREYNRFWRENDYLHIKNALTREMVSLFDDNIMFNERVAADDPRQFYRIHHDKASSWIISGYHVAAQDYYKAVLSADLMRMDAFAMKYMANSDLLPHYDNIFTVISSTVCYRCGPDGKRNPLFLDRAKFLNPYQQRLTVADKAGIPPQNIVELDLGPGDIGIFRGRTHLHWRETSVGELDCRAILAHYSDSGYDSVLKKPEFIRDIPSYLVDMSDYREFRMKYAAYFEHNGQSWI